MLVLALDTSTPAVTAGLAELGDDEIRTLGERITLDARAHGELLTPHVLDALTQAGTTLRSIEAIVCGVGPGPFTGLRAGIATAGALGHSLDVAAHPVCGLDAIAADTPCEGRLLVTTDARRRELYWAGYGADGTRIDGPAVGPAAELPSGFDATAGQGGDLYDLGLPVIGPKFPTVRGLVLAAAASLRMDARAQPLTPLYLRRPDAVEPGARKRVNS